MITATDSARLRATIHATPTAPMPHRVRGARNEDPENCAECDGTGVSRERGRIVCRPCRGTGAALPSTTDALAERGGG